MKKLFITICGVAVLSGLSHLAYAEGQGVPGPGKFTPEMKAKMEQRREEFNKRLNLTSEQKEKMKTIHEESKAQIKPLFESIRAEKEKLRQLKSSNASQQDIQAQRDKIRQIKDQMRTIRKANFEKVQAILTPQQRTEFEKMRQEHKKQMKNHKGKFDKGKSERE